MLNPCCGGDLRNGTKVVAIFEIIFCTIGTILVGIVALMAIFWGTAVFGMGVMYATTGERPTEHPPVDNDEDYDGQRDKNKVVGGKAIAFGIMIVVIGIIAFISRLASLLMAIILLKGAKEEDPTRCRIWFIYTIVMWILSIVSLFFNFWPSFVTVILSPYFMWVVYAYIKELQEGRPRGVVVFTTQPKAV